MWFKNKKQKQKQNIVLYLYILSIAAFADMWNFKINNNSTTKQQGNWQLRKGEEFNCKLHANVKVLIIWAMHFKLLPDNTL